MIPACAVTSVNSTGANLSGSGGKVETKGDGDTAAFGEAVVTASAGGAVVLGWVVGDDCWHAAKKTEARRKNHTAAHERSTLISFLTIKV